MLTLEIRDLVKVSGNDDPDIEEAIDKVCSYKPTNYFFIKRRYKNYDGVHFYRNGIFPYGLLERVTRTLKDKGIEFELRDGRTPPRGAGLSEKGPLALRPYQDKALSAFRQKDHVGIINAATGSGKTILGIAAIKELDVPTIIYVPTQVLLYQWKKEIETFISGTCGTIGDGKCIIKPVTVAMYQTVAKTLRDNPFSRYVKDEWKMDDDRTDLVGKEEAILSFMNSVGLMVADECLPMGTGILTPYGIKRIEDLNIGDEVYSFNDKTSRVEIDLVSNKVERPFNGELVNFFNPRVDISVTPEHKMLVTSKFGRILKAIQAKDLRTDMVDSTRFITVSIDERRDGSIHGKKFTRKKDNYVVRLSNPSMTVRAIKTCNVPYHGPVYDITVEKHHNFFAGNDGKLVLVSNCHTVGAQTFLKVAINTPARYKLGLSATSLMRPDGANLAVIAGCGEPCSDITTSELIRGGYLAPLVVKIVTLSCMDKKRKDGDEDGMAEYNRIKKEHVLSKERNAHIVEHTKALLEEGRTTLVLVSEIGHGRLLKQMLEEKVGRPVPFLCGTTAAKKRMKTIDSMKKKEECLVISTSIFEYGLDIPLLSGLVVASPSKSMIRTIQRVGRILRTHPEKKNAKIVDFDDINADYFRDHFMERMKFYVSEPEFTLEYDGGDPGIVRLVKRDKETKEFLFEWERGLR